MAPKKLKAKWTTEEWNAKYPTGTQVTYWPGRREGEGVSAWTRGEAWSLGDGTPVVAVSGYSGGIGLTHVEPVVAAEPESMEPKKSEGDPASRRSGPLASALAKLIHGQNTSTFARLSVAEGSAVLGLERDLWIAEQKAQR